MRTVPVDAPQTHGQVRLGRPNLCVKAVQPAAHKRKKGKVQKPELSTDSQTYWYGHLFCQSFMAYADGVKKIITADTK
jgi:hypothetical protein